MLRICVSTSKQNTHGYRKRDRRLETELRLGSALSNTIFRSQLEIPNVTVQIALTTRPRPFITVSALIKYKIL